MTLHPAASHPSDPDGGSAPGTGLPRRRWPPAGVLVPAVCAGLVAGLAGGALVVAFRDRAGGAGTAQSRTAQTDCDVEHVADEVLPSVVTLQVQGGEGASTGSGVVVRTPLLTSAAPAGHEDPETFIVTNEHVVGPATSSGRLKIVWSDGSSSAGRVAGADATTDLAAVAPDSLPPHARPAALGSSRHLRVGQRVVALGAPLGLTSTVTTGIVSATERYVRVPSASGPAHHLVGAIQTDAAVNPGNSGGALVDCSGHLVGINAAGASPPGDHGSVGLNFAIPSVLFAPLTQQLLTTGRVQHPTLGLQVVPFPAERARRAGASGLLVQGIDARGPGQKAGIRINDVLVEVDGKPVRVPDDLTQVELGLRVGSAVHVVVERAGQRHTVSVVPVESD